MNRESLIFPQWIDLESRDKLEILQKIARRIAKGFILKEMTTFTNGEITFETGILERGAVEYIFIPGMNNVILGWNTEEEYYSPEFIQRIEEDLKTWENGWCFNKFMKASKGDYSPRRVCNIPPMIVERRNTPISEGINDFKELERYFRRNGCTYLNEDQWEYLASTSKRSIYKWGNEIPSNTTFEDLSKLAQLPNGFGLFIASDPYEWELVKNSEWLVKGGDGGGSICGGYGLAIGFLETSPYKRDTNLSYDDYYEYFYEFKIRRVYKL